MFKNDKVDCWIAHQWLPVIAEASPNTGVICFLRIFGVCKSSGYRGLRSSMMSKLNYKSDLRIAQAFLQWRNRLHTLVLVLFSITDSLHSQMLPSIAGMNSTRSEAQLRNEEVLTQRTNHTLEMELFTGMADLAHRRAPRR
jgi:hypothetical protein